MTVTVCAGVAVVGCTAVALAVVGCAAVVAVATVAGVVMADGIGGRRGQGCHGP